MRPYILPDPEAARVPGVLLFLFCFVYLLTGLTPRSPWGTADATGFGIALTMAQGGLEQWLMPSVFGLAQAQESPLAYWLLAGAIRLGEPWLGEHPSALLATGLLVAPGLYFVWKSALLFAARPEVQPSDPFGASAARPTIARTMADAALLVTLACCGLIVRLHETTAEAIQFTWMALLLYGGALVIERPRRGGLLSGLALGASALCSGPLLAMLLAAGWLVAQALGDPQRLVARDSIPIALGTALLVFAVWPLALVLTQTEGLAWLSAWWQANGLMLGTTQATLVDLARTLPWFVWPAWPLALWTLIRWRALWREPALALPLCCAAAVIAGLLLQSRAPEQAMIPLTIPLALLAVWGLPTIARGLVGLLDWMAVALFSAFGIFIWGYWIALQTGHPPRMALSANRLAPGHAHEDALWTGLIGLIVTLSWLWLIRWRTAPGPRLLWRPMVLSASGLVLAWVLLVSLWLPVFDERKSLRGPAREAATMIGIRADEPSTAQPCVTARHLNAAQRVGFAHFGAIRFGAAGEACRWLLSTNDALPPDAATGSSRPGWVQVWQGGRRFEPGERFTLFRRVD
jgi:hypothetical protein